MSEHHKIHADHLARLAYLYVRQSTLRQVVENTESTERQYALRQRAVALGWPDDRIVVVDDDQGQSGASADRQGFQRLVADVGLGRAGIVMGLEVSRFARNNVEWHRLLEICALAKTLILDEDGLYDPAHYNDRLLLGLKGTMSEAELHMLRARLNGGKMNKARRGELMLRLPVGLLYNDDEKVVLDPDKQVQDAIRTLFETFRRTGSAGAVIRHFREHGLRFPRRPVHGPHKGELLWKEIDHTRVLNVLHNPRYAGAFCYGRHRKGIVRDRRQTARAMADEQWHVLIADAHDGYVSWDQLEENRRILRENAPSIDDEKKRSAPREGPALLQGLIMCGRCGERMTVSYGGRSTPRPIYRCQARAIARAEKSCQEIPGTSVDDAIGKLVVEAVTPLALEVSITVQTQIEHSLDEADRLRRQQVERAEYEAQLARRRYMSVDPDNRLVVDTLEADWNHKLRGLRSAQDEYERQSEADRLILDDDSKKEVLALATDFPRQWSDPATPQRERKRMLRLLIDDVTLTRTDQITAAVRFRGGATEILTLPLPAPIWKQQTTPKEVIAEIDRLLEDHPDDEIAEILNRASHRPGGGGTFTGQKVSRIRRDYRLIPRRQRLRDRELISAEEIAARMGVTNQTVRRWKRKGLLRAHVIDGCLRALYEKPDFDKLRAHVGREGRRRSMNTSDARSAV